MTPPRADQGAACRRVVSDLAPSTSPLWGLHLPQIGLQSLYSEDLTYLLAGCFVVDSHLGLLGFPGISNYRWSCGPEAGKSEGCLKRLSALIVRSFRN